MSIAKVLIVGGIGGLCAAIALPRKGIEVDLVEIKTGPAGCLPQRSSPVSSSAHSWLRP